MASAELHDGVLTGITYLGCFCFEEEVRADAAIQADLIRSTGIEPMICGDDLAVCELVCAATGCERAEVPLHCHRAVPDTADEAPADICLHAAKLRARVDSFVLQLSLLMELPGLMCLILGLAPLTAAAICLLPLPLMVLCALPDDGSAAALTGILLHRLGVLALTSSVAALGAAAYARGCGLSADGVLLIVIAPMLAYAVWLCGRQLHADKGGFGFAPPAVIAAFMLLLALSMGPGAVGFGFGSLIGIAALILGMKLSTIHHKVRTDRTES